MLASNRDEFWSRPTTPMHWWNSNENHNSDDATDALSTDNHNNPTVPTILAGQDLKQGGTWLAMQSHTHRFAAVTNFREPHVPDCSGGLKLSRGKLVTDFVASSSTSVKDFISCLEKDSHNYSGFNLLFGSPTVGYYFFSNRGADKVVPLQAGQIYGICNGTLDEPWPKLMRGKQAFAKLLQSAFSNTQSASLQAVDADNNNNNCHDDDLRIESLKQGLWQVLTDEWKPPESDLPDTGVGLKWETILSSIFVQGCSGIDYGTRCSTVVLQTADGAWEVQERTYRRQEGHDNRVVHPRKEYESRCFRL